MQVLFDTNIIIERENPKIPNSNAGKLFICLDKMGARKLIHPATIEEIDRYNNPKEKAIIFAKLSSYEMIKCRPDLPQPFLDKIKNMGIHDSNNRVDNEMLFQVYDGRVDLLITEDREMHRKAAVLEISDKVFNIEGYLEVFNKEHPQLIEYKALSIKKVPFATIDLADSFFDSFRNDYPYFNKWYRGKSNEEAYICRSDKDEILGFLYIKKETAKEDYTKINPTFNKADRLKVSSFKVISTGFRLGERFIKIIFDNAVIQNVDEIYVTLFEKREELKILKDLFLAWGFKEHGKTTDLNETVLVKPLRKYIENQRPRMNFPLIQKEVAKRFLPIEQRFHTNLFPDSILSNESFQDFIENKAYRYAIQKIYIAWASLNGVKSGDIVFIYRNGNLGHAAYTGVVTTICIVDEICFPKTADEFHGICNNRSVFTHQELQTFWDNHRIGIKIIKLLFYKSLKSKVTLKQLWDANIIDVPNGPRSFDIISEENARKILKMSDTDF